jgi:hypothetical protein
MLVVTFACAAASAQTFHYYNFNSVTGLVLNGSAGRGHQVPPETKPVLRLMDGLGSHGQESSAWYGQQVSVTGGFAVGFSFNLNTCAGISCADGFAFVIQNAAAGTAAIGDFGGYLGYSESSNSAGIENSLAIEFDTFQNFDFSDPNANHVAVQSCGTAPNTADHATCNLSLNATLPITLTDGANHNVRIAYTPGRLLTTIDGVLVMNTPVDLSTLLNLPNGTAYVGFTAGAGSGGENSDILNWLFMSN